MNVAVRTVASILALVCTASLDAQESIRLVESFPSGAQYQVSCRVKIAGSLAVPAEKGQPPKILRVTGDSAIEYDERILKENARRVERTIRFYRRLDVKRALGSEEQQSSLRPAVHRLVILRHKQYEVPFSPAGPLTWGEIDLVRTDVFTPALQGLLPSQAVRLGDSWRADPEAVQELTDLEEIKEGSLTCRLEKVTTFAGRRLAYVSFQGRVGGIGEDGKAVHDLEGTLYFDLEARYLAYLDVKGTHHLPGPEGQQGGKIDGRFTLTREPIPLSLALSDDALRGLVLEPNEENTQLLFDNPALGVRFLYPRNWHVAGTNPRQLGLDEKEGSGLLLVIDPGAPAPSAVQQFYQAQAKGLTAQKAEIRRIGTLQSLQPGLTTFTIEAVIAKKAVTMQYYVIQQPAGTVTLSATLQARAGVARDVERIARSVQISAPR
jgi:hypothetical protein